MLANPNNITYVWRRENDTKITENGYHLVSDGPVLNLTNAQKSDTGIYKLFATNELGTSETSIRINVQCKIASRLLFWFWLLFSLSHCLSLSLSLCLILSNLIPIAILILFIGPSSIETIDPAIIKKSSDIILIEEYQNAHLECYVDSNPFNEHVIKWFRRRNNSDDQFLSPSSSLSSSSSSLSSYDDDQEPYFNRMHSEIEIFSDDQQQFSDGSRIKSSLLIMNATIHDSGTSFDCIADNGIGKPSKSTTTLLVLRKFFTYLFSFFFWVDSFYPSKFFLWAKFFCLQKNVWSRFVELRFRQSFLFWMQIFFLFCPLSVSEDNEIIMPINENSGEQFHCEIIAIETDQR